MSKTKKLKGIDLFAGCGGFSLGVSRAGIEVVAAVEMAIEPCQTMAVNKERAFPTMKIVNADISKLSGIDLLSMVNLKPGELDVLFGGPPCQGFTFVNSNRSINDPRSKLMWEFVRMIQEIQPRYFVIENVPGLLSFKDFFYELLTQLEMSNYEVRFNVLDAASYLVPQTRRRVFIEGGRADLKITPVFPEPICYDPKMINNNQLVSPADVAVECFRKNGFRKDEVGNTWWNRKLNILMNKKNASQEVDLAVNRIIARKVFKMAQSVKSA